jgi:ribosomal protein S19
MEWRRAIIYHMKLKLWRLAGQVVLQRLDRSYRRKTKKLSVIKTISNRSTILEELMFLETVIHIPGD